MKTARFVKNGKGIDAKGKNKETITKQVFGQSAELSRNWDRNSPYKYNVVRSDKYGTHLLGQFYSIEDYEGSQHQKAIKKPAKKKGILGKK